MGESSVENKPPKDIGYTTSNKERRSRTNLLTTIAPVVALTFFANACHTKSRQITETVTPTVVTRQLEKPTPTTRAGETEHQAIKTPENAKANTVILDPSVEGIVKGRVMTIDAQRQTLEKIEEGEPDFLDAPFVLTKREDSRYDEVANRIIINVDWAVSADHLKTLKRHEQAHEMTNRTWLKKHLDPDDFEKAVAILDQAFNEPVWQTPFPNLDELFDPISNTVSDVPKPSDGPEQIAAIVKNHAKFSYIEGYGNDPFNEITNPLLAKFKAFALEDSQNGLQTLSIPDLFRKEQASGNTRLVQLEEDVQVQKALQRVRSILPLLEPGNLRWISFYSNDLRLDQGWSSLEKLTQLAMIESAYNQDPSFPQDENSSQYIRTRLNVATGEMLADLASLKKAIQERDMPYPLAPLEQLLENAINTN